MLPNLAIILTVFAVSFTIGWGVYFLSLQRRENSPNCMGINDPHAELDGWMGNLGGLNRDTQ
jgi:hypothetical protein